MAWHVVVGMQVTIVAEVIPELVDVLRIERCQHGLLQEVRIVLIDALRQSVHQELLHIATVARQHVRIVHHARHVLQFRHVACLLGPFGKERGMLQHVQVFARPALLLVHDGTLSQQLQVLGAPAKLHAHLRTQSGTIVNHAIVIVHQRTRYQHQSHVERSVVALRAIGIEVHLVSLTSQSAQRQVAHHHDGACGLILLQRSLGHHSLPVVLLDAMLHPYLVVEVLVLIPPMPHAPCQRSHQ